MKTSFTTFKNHSKNGFSMVELLLNTVMNLFHIESKNASKSLENPVFEGNLNQNDDFDLLPNRNSNLHDTSKIPLSNLKEFAMNQLSFQEDSYVRSYQISSYFDEDTKSWVQKKTVIPAHDAPNLDKEMKENLSFSGKKSVFTKAAATLLLVLSAVFGFAQSQADIRIGKMVSNGMPALNSSVTYTLYAINEGSTPATNVVIQDNFPATGATANTAGIVAPSGTTFNTGTFQWTIPTLAAGDSIAVTIPATVISRGVYFNTAEVISMAGTDIDSTPNNNSLVEDDFAAACFSVPLYWYVGDEYTVSVPAPYSYGTGIKWFRNGVEITPASTDATVNADNSLTIKKIGSYTFTTTLSTCPATGCCAVEIIQGPYGSLGDYVWTDLNNDGIQNDGPTSGIKDVVLELYKADAAGNPIGLPIQTTKTDATGFYTFDSLFTDKYIVKLVSTSLPANNVITSQTDLGGDDTKDSDFNSMSGLSPPININAEGTGISKDNPTIDGAIFVKEFDLALKKTSTATTVVAGQNVTFTLTVYNQGNIDAKDIQLTDYIPTGLTLNDANWTASGATATLNTPIANLASSATATVSITFTVSPTFTGSLTNSAEISGAKDPQGNPATDKDSTPDGNPSNDGTPKDDVVNEDRKANPANDEDDSDPATITVSPAPVFDLALKKTTTATNVSVGQDVTFTIEVLNQGTVTAKDIVVTDYIPAGFTLNDPSWTAVAGGANKTIAGPIAGGASTTTTIILKVAAGATNATLKNNAEISSAKDEAGNTPTDKDSTPDSDPANDGTAKDDIVNEDRKANPTTDDEDDSDFASVTLTPIFDLALKKTVVNPNVTPGQDVTFTVTVYNQGEVAAKDIAISDYIPTGLTLNDANWTASAGVATLNTPIANLAVGASTTVNITFTVSATASGSIVNTAEISSAKDADGNPATDKDSTPDSNPSNDGTPKDDVVNEDRKTNPANDEDDSDPATINVSVYDIALKKTTTATTVTAGQDVTFTIDVFNQGTAAVQDVIVTDYIPTGFTLNDGSWLASGTTASKTIAGPIAAGASTSVTIILKVANNVAAGTLTNTAEVSSMKNSLGSVVNDVDSTPDSNPANDGTPKDNVTNEDRKANPANDEDDSDPASVVVEPVFDLALKKTTTATSVVAGQDVTFTIEVTNQGNVEAKNIQISDYIPTGLQLNDLDWAVSSGVATMVDKIPSLAAGASTQVNITFKVTQTTAGNIVNTAEISSATDANGNPATDKDSNLDGDPTNDGTAKDDIVNEDRKANSANDEDDSDPATISVTTAPVFDLALKKTTTATVVKPGDKVLFTIEVFNQGTVTAKDIVVTDYIPSGFILADTKWSGTTAATRTLAGPLAAGSSDTLNIILQVLPTAVDGTLTNNAEISSAKDLDNIAQTDKDSTPDSNPSNDGTAKDNVINEDRKTNPADDEDDSDPASVLVETPKVFDLALRKTTTASSVVAGQNVTFTITVFNQGNVDAKDIQITDYIPSGLTLADANWTASGSTATLNTPIASLAAGTSTTVNITFTVSPSVTGSVVNNAEISAAKDPQGNTPTDKDSTPDNVFINDGTPKDNVIDEDGKNGGDEDDSDLALITVTPAPVFDLALRKTSTATSVVAGQNVTFTLTVLNQGNVGATAIQLTDYIPSGLTLNDANWTASGSTATLNTPIASLAAGASTTVNITFTVSPTATGSITNSAEISSAKDPQGNTPTDKDSTPDGNPSNDGTPKDDVVTEDRKTNPADDEDDSDPATITVTPAPVFDLALRKTSTATSVVAGQNVTFTLTVLNQGNVGATAIQLTDYIPSGLTLNDANWTANAGVATLNTPIASLAAGASTTVNITFTVSPTATGSITNNAEISAAKDPQGNTPTDKDSTPDGNPSNDGTPKDDVVTEDRKTNPADDEDDSDPATITVTPAPVFDLALRKTSTATSVVAGQNVTFTLTVLNQGNVGATAIQLTDYIPTGLTLADANWTASGSTATLNTPIASLAAGASTTVNITFTVSATATGSITNNAEISAAKDPQGNTPTDKDSTPDGNPSNDGTPKDDVVTEDRKTNPADDEDDSDPATITVMPAPVFDLALRKVVSPTTLLPIIAGQDVTFNIEILNQGTETARDIVVTDYIPTGFTLNDPSWTAVSGGASKTITGPLAAGTSTTTTIILKLSNTASGTIRNNAEISSAKDGAGNPATDKDSTPDNNPANDGVAKDNVVNEDGKNGGDEDDSDYAEVTVGTCATLIVSTTDGDICVGDTTYIKGVTTNGRVKWFLVSTGGTAIATTNSNENYMVFPTTTTTYYAELESATQGCPNARQPVIVVVNARPSTPTCTGLVEECSGTMVDLTKYVINGITTPGGAFEWRTGANPSSSLVTNPMSVGAGTYYLFEKSGAGCYSNPVQLKVVYKNCDKIIDLSLTKTVNPTTVNQNDNVTYTITVSNAGPDVATGVEVKDVLPAGLQFVSSSNFSNASGTLTAMIPTINSGQVVTLSFVAKVIGTGSIANYAEVSKADQKDNDSTPNNGKPANEDDGSEAVVKTNTVEPMADLSIDKSVGNAAPAVNDIVVYTIKVTNGGPDKATNVEVTDVLPAGLQLISVSGGTNSFVAGNTAIATFNEILSGATVQFTINAKVLGTGTIKNWAQVTKSDQKDPDSTPNNGGGTTTNEDDDDDADIIVNVTCNPITPIVACSNPFICNGESTTLSAIGCNGTVVWSDGQTGAMITVTPSVTTAYTAVCKVNDNCVSGKSNTVTVVVNTSAPPVVTASATTVCGGGKVQLSAAGCTGSVIWSDGQSGASITVSPTSTTTYTAICKKATCTSGKSAPVTITVGAAGAAPVVATSKPNICSGESSGLTATGCLGTVVWSNGQSGSAISVSPATTTTYTAVCMVGSCSSNTSSGVTVTVGNGGSTLTVTASKNNLCEGESATLTASGCASTISWSNGQSGSSITVTPTATTTYTATCAGSTGSCGGTGSATVTVAPKPVPPVVTCGSERICAGEALTFTAHNCSGTVNWSTGAVGSTMIVNPTTNTTYTATCTVNGCKSNPSTGGAITVITETPTITASKETTCSGEAVTLTAAGCSGTLTWSTGATTNVITVTPTATTIYSVTCKVENCEGKASKTITVGNGTGTPLAITASKPAVCEGEAVTLVATGCTSTVTWSNGQSGSSISVTPTATTTYTASCAGAAGSCGGTGSATVTVTPKPTPPVVTCGSERICAGEALIFTAHNCSGTVNWSTGAVGSTMIVNPTVNTTYTATCTINGCVSNPSSGGAITVITETPTITASKETIGCGDNSVTLTAAGCSGTLTWSTGATTNTIIVSPTATTTYSVTCKVENCEGKATKTITVSGGSPTAPTITASAGQICEPSNVTLTAAGCTGTVIWSNTQTGAVITVNVSTTTTFTATCKSGDCVSPASSPVTVTVGKPSKPTISADQTTVCAGDAVKLIATGCDGTLVWSNGLTGNNVTVNPTTTTNYTAVCKLPAGGCTSDASNTVTVTVTGKPDSPVISCSASRICKGDSLILNGLNCAGTVVWMNGMTGNSITITPQETTVYTAICKVGSCESAPSAAATITVGNPIPPVISCKNTQICAGSSTIIEAAGCTGTVVWSDGQKGAVITVSPTTLTSYSAICDGGRCQSEKSNVISVQVTGSGLKKPTTKDLVNICPFTTVDLTTGVTSAVSSSGGVYVFRTGTTAGSPAVANPAQAGTGTYYAFEKAGNGCYSEASPINVQITNCNDNTGNTCTTNPATANAGKDSTLCLQSDSFTLNGKIGGAATSAKWTTDGTGSFENSLSLTSKYNFSVEDVNKGTVKFTLTTNDPDDNGTCQAATSSFTLTIKAVKTKPSIETDKSPNICFGDSVKLTATPTATGYKWSNGATTRSITVKTPGQYSVRLVGADGCSSLSSDGTSVNVGASITAPVVNELTKNTCPATTVNLSSVVTSQPKSANGAFEFHTAADASSPILANAGAVGAGTYYVFEKSPIGCYSAGSKIIVSIDQCNVTSDTTSTDVQITIVGSRVELKIDESLEYTITVKNNGPKPATNVKVVNNLPKQQGLVVTSTTPGLTAVGDSLIGTIANLAVGESKTFTYTAKLKKAGKITNTAKITGVTPTDKITSNNISQWTVECKTCQEACIGLALSADTTRQTNGSYNVTFRAIIENCGNLKLEGVEIKENLAAMFNSPTTFTVVQKPTAGVGSKLVTNDNFNGTTDVILTKATGSILEQAASDTVKFVINVVPNGNDGPFSTNATVAAMAQTIFGIPAETSDVSNDGKIVDKQSATPTVIKLFKSPSIGLALSVIDTVKKADGSYDVRFQAIVKNTGSLPLNGVTVCDSLSKTIKAPATFTVVGTTTKNASSQLVINNAYNGASVPCLTTGGTLAVGKTDTLKYVVNIKPNGTTSFNAQSTASGTGTLADNTTQTVSTVSSAGTNPDSPSKNPTTVGLGGDGNQSVQIPCIGIALFVKDTTKKADGSYNITYNAIIKNCGNVNLKDVALCDTLANTFTSPAVATMVGKPTLSAGSTLKVDTTYNGVTKTCMLLPAESTLVPNKVDTLTWTVNVKLNDNKGPFRNSVKVTAKTPSGQEVFDISNDGVNPNPEGSAQTVVNFNALPENLIGIAKESDKPVKVKDNVYDLKFTFRVKNYGKSDIQRVQVQENLAQVFGDSVKIDSVNIVSVEQGFTKNTRFTGKGNLINLLVDSTSTLPKNTTRSIVLFARVDISGSNRSKFENQALAIGKNGLVIFDDISTDGTNPDPDANANPKDNSVGTPIDLGNIVNPNPTTVTPLGIAKSVDSTRNRDGSYNLKYTVIVKNYGKRELTDVQLSDSLDKVFANATFALVSKPTISAGSTLKLDTAFNGRANAKLLLADSKLGVGKSDTLKFTVAVANKDSLEATYSNTVYGSAKDSTATVTDMSNSGLNPDANANNNPGDDNAATVIKLGGKKTPPTAMGEIPGGFSPNGDNINDNFVIDGITGTDRASKLYIYNRYGHLVYQSLDFAKEANGWDGRSNAGIKILEKDGYVPSGTYYYCIEAEGAWDGKPKFGFITIVR